MYFFSFLQNQFDFTKVFKVKDDQKQHAKLLLHAVSDSKG